jgi:hypothetical protein
MNDAEDLGKGNLSRQARNTSNSPERAAGNPLPMGNGGRAARPDLDDALQFSTISPPGRALSRSPEPKATHPLLSALRMALPMMRKVLPLLNGPIANSVSDLLFGLPLPQQPGPPARHVDLDPIKDELAALQAQQIELRNQVVEQNNTLKRVEDQLEMVRDATDRNTLEQQELLDAMKALGDKAKFFSYAVLVLLAIFIVLNVILLLHLRRVLP